MLVILVDRLGAIEGSWMLRVAYCESTDNPLAENPSGAEGLYQFMPSTFAGTAPGRAGQSIWSARAQAFAAAWLYAKDGGGREWQCQ